MLDCGITNLTFTSSYNLVGVLLSHSHSDHIAGLKKDNYLGNIKVYGNNETLQECKGLMNFQKVIISNTSKFFVGNEWICVPFNVPHDKLNTGYIIYNKYTKHKALYITDVGSLENLAFNDIDTYIIECNYDEEYYKQLDYLSGERILNDDESNDLVKYKRLSSGVGHISVQQLIEFLKRDVSDRTKNIILIHISHSIKRYKDMEKKVKLVFPDKNVVAISNKLVRDKKQITKL